MFKFYLYPISYAFLTFPVAAMLFTLPFLIVQYRRHGYINKLRAWMLYLFLLYLMNALYLVILPLPSTRHNAPPNVESYMQWIPFHFIEDIMRETRIVPSEPSTYWRLFQERAFWQVALNIALVIPFGMFMRYYFRTRWITCLVASFSLSLFFEITQVTALYGFFDYPYRLFDVDDLMLNTLGGMIGFVLAAWISAILPRIDQLDQNVDLSTKRVSYTRRAIALMLDWMLLFPLIVAANLIHLPAAYFVLTALYFIVLPYAMKGMTPGKLVVRIRISGQEQPATLRELVIRNGLLYLGLGGINISLLGSSMTTAPIVHLLVFAVDVWFTIHVLIRLFNHDKPLFYEKASRTVHKIS
ncbi:VanZ family protein [Paenibacillus pinihumi]|uniref:VanZ family protein n=1 Tax=Paenibacillus pinihumi TaxID=669462 RepID=UPI000429BFFE|nr:VanZ family protein [Paenibacillus pinihumi]